MAGLNRRLPAGNYTDDENNNAHHKNYFSRPSRRAGQRPETQSRGYKSNDQKNNAPSEHNLFLLHFKRLAFGYARDQKFGLTKGSLVNLASGLVHGLPVFLDTAGEVGGKPGDRELFENTIGGFQYYLIEISVSYC